MNPQRLVAGIDRSIERFPVKIAEHNWWRIILIVWAMIFTVAYRDSILPASWWMTVDSVKVADARAGVAPRMFVVREIRRAFSARWTVEVEIEDGDGFEVICTGTGFNNYNPANRLPRDLDLTWWLGRECPLAPGRYRVETTWMIYGNNGARKRINKPSNVFTVFPSRG